MSFKYRPEIDGLRAIAVLSVIIFHAFPSYLQGGFIGVDIFFVISGFLITNLIAKEIPKSKHKKRKISRSWCKWLNPSRRPRLGSNPANRVLIF